MRRLYAVLLVAVLLFAAVALTADSETPKKKPWYKRIKPGTTPAALEHQLRREQFEWQKQMDQAHLQSQSATHQPQNQWYALLLARLDEIESNVNTNRTAATAALEWLKVLDHAVIQHSQHSEWEVVPDEFQKEPPALTRPKR